MSYIIAKTAGISREEEIHRGLYDRCLQMCVGLWFWGPPKPHSFFDPNCLFTIQLLWGYTITIVIVYIGERLHVKVVFGRKKLVPKNLSQNGGFRQNCV